MHILEKRQWEKSSSKKHFESGVRMGVGTFNLMVSLLPGRVIRLLEFIGFSGNKVKSFGIHWHLSKSNDYCLYENSKPDCKI